MIDVGGTMMQGDDREKILDVMRHGEWLPTQWIARAARASTATGNAPATRSIAARAASDVT